MNKRLIAFLSILSINLAAFITPAEAIENGISALNNPRVVSMYFKVSATDGTPINTTGCTGWLYAPRLVFTNGHCVHDFQKRPEKVFFDLEKISVGIPGEKTNPQISHIKAIKTYSYPTFEFYNASVGGTLSYKDDFAIVVLEKPLSNVKTANLLTKPMLDELLSKETFVSTAGYGLQSKAERDSANYAARFVEPKSAKYKIIPFSQGMNVVNEYKNKWRRNYFQEDVVFMDVPKNGPSPCDGDSGSGFYLDSNDVFTYLGVTHTNIGVPNCLNEEWGSSGGIAAFRPVFLDSELINQAEKYVADNPYVDPKLKTAGANKKIIITCVKGKTTKNVSGINPKCPVGFKKK